MNDAVIEWKRATPNQFKARAHVQGRYVRTLKVRPSHVHFELRLATPESASASPAESIELIYNREFGDMPPEFTPNSEVSACGDYITANASAGRYEPSPLGAIIHWVHFNPGDRDGGKHPHGFVWVAGKLFGQTMGRNPSESNERRRRNQFLLEYLLPEAS
jgi:hypothetical protein